MKLKQFGQRSGLDVAAISMGAMRFPKDTDEAAKIIRHGIDSGLQYIDTCRRYGDSELKLREALKNGYREKVILSTKWSPWNDPEKTMADATASCVRAKIDESLERLGVDYLDFYQAWDVKSRECYEHFTAKGGMLEGVLAAKKEGLIKHIGMTTHDSVENVLDYIKQSEWIEILLVTYNMMNRRYAPVLEAAKKQGIGTLVMNPVGGGLFSEESEALSPLVEEAGAVSIPDMAIRYILSNPNVDTMLIGLSKISDVDDSIASESRGALNSKTIEKIEAFFDAHNTEKANFCSKCGYCMPCPQGINIPAIMEAVFLKKSLGLSERAKRIYMNSGEKRAEACNECGRCEKQCTQKLKITKHMKYALQHIAP